MRVAAVVFFSTVISGVASAAIAGSCNNPAGGMCIEYNGAGYKDSLRLQRTCEALKSTFISGGGCPAAGLVGSCLRSKGEPLESTYRYYTQFPGSGNTFTREKVASEGQRQCKPKGEWTLN
jgi:hypothetical protein